MNEHTRPREVRRAEGIPRAWGASVRPRHRFPFRAALLVVLLAVGVVSIRPAVASERSPVVDPSPMALPDDAALEAAGAVIGEVTVRAEDIFDPEKPGEDNLLFRAANRLHLETRERVVRRQLLFRSGDRYASRLLAESERNLRANGYLYDASVRPVRYDGERVDVEVRTRDVWTLNVGLGFGRNGGSNSTRFGLQDKNFLGSGKDLSLKRTSNVDRSEMNYGFTDPALFGTRGRLSALYSDNSDGTEAALRLERPFYSLATRWALGVTARSGDRVASLWERGTVASSLRHESDSVSLYAGRSSGLVNGRTRRLLYGFNYERDRLRPDLPSGAPLGPIVEERVLSYPWIGFERIDDGYITTRDLDKIRRTEDLNLGRVVRGHLGLSAPAFGGDRTRVIYDASFTQGLNPGLGQMLFVDASLAGRWTEGAAENLLLSAGGRYYLRSGEHRVLYLSLRGDVANDLDSETQLVAGAEEGLRGYPLRFTTGDRRVLLTAEQRFYSSRHLLNLVHMGAAVFFDAGRAWQEGDGAARRSSLLKDVGIGLRFSSSRSAKGGMLKIDLAFPLDREPGIPSSQFSITAGETF